MDPGETCVILEVAILDIKAEAVSEFQADFNRAQQILVSMPGYLGHELQQCIEQPSRHILLVRWQTLTDHTVGFRESAQYQEWKALLHHYYDPVPRVEHYQPVYPNDGSFQAPQRKKIGNSKALNPASKNQSS